MERGGRGFHFIINVSPTIVCCLFVHRLLVCCLFLSSAGLFASSSAFCWFVASSFVVGQFATSFFQTSAMTAFGWGSHSHRLDARTGRMPTQQSCLIRALCRHLVDGIENPALHFCYPGHGFSKTEFLGTQEFSGYPGPSSSTQFSSAMSTPEYGKIPQKCPLSSRAHC